jgi:hypothetical protein
MSGLFIGPPARSEDKYISYPHQGAVFTLSFPSFMTVLPQSVLPSLSNIIILPISIHGYAALDSPGINAGESDSSAFI